MLAAEHRALTEDQLVYDDNADDIYVAGRKPTRSTRAGITSRSPRPMRRSPTCPIASPLRPSASASTTDREAAARHDALKDVRLSTAMTATGDSTGLRVGVRNNRLVVADAS